MFAETGGDVNLPGWVVAAGALVTAGVSAVTGIAGAAVVFMKVYLPYRLEAGKQEAAERSEGRKQEDAGSAAAAQRRKDEFEASLNAYRDLLADYQRQGERQAQTIRDQQQVIEALQRDHVECRQDYAELRERVYFLYDTVRRQHLAMQAKGMDPGPLLELPPLRERAGPNATDFLARQVAQKAQTVAEGSRDLATRQAGLPGPPEASGENPPR